MEGLWEWHVHSNRSMFTAFPVMWPAATFVCIVRCLHTQYQHVNPPGQERGVASHRTCGVPSGSSRKLVVLRAQRSPSILKVQPLGSISTSPSAQDAGRSRSAALAAQSAAAAAHGTDAPSTSWVPWLPMSNRDVPPEGDPTERNV